MHKYIDGLSMVAYWSNQHIAWGMCKYDYVANVTQK